MDQKNRIFHLDDKFLSIYCCRPFCKGTKEETSYVQLYTKRMQKTVTILKLQSPGELVCTTNIVSNTVI